MTMHHSMCQCFTPAETQVKHSANSHAHAYIKQQSVHRDDKTLLWRLLGNRQKFGMERDGKAKVKKETGEKRAF